MKFRTRALQAANHVRGAIDVELNLLADLTPEEQMRAVVLILTSIARDVAARLQRVGGGLQALAKGIGG